MLKILIIIKSVERQIVQMLQTALQEHATLVHVYIATMTLSVEIMFVTKDSAHHATRTSLVMLSMA
jgi:hypothetical protein